MLSYLFRKKLSFGISRPSKIYFSPNSIISDEGIISLELDNRFHLYESKGKTLVYDINSKSRVFYGDFKLDNSVDFVLEKSYYSLDSLVKRGILRDVSLFDAFSELNILDIFLSSINYLSGDNLRNHVGLTILEYLVVTGLNVPLKYEFSKVLSAKFYILTNYGSKYLYMSDNNLNVFNLRTLHEICVK
jgi:hypothetical protein